MAKRRVFISFYHRDEQQDVDNFVEKFSEDYEVFTDKSIDRAADSEDPEYLNQVCRDAIDGTSVTIVMIGEQTGCRKFVDWEIRYTLHKKHGLVGISRPGLDDSDACLPMRLSDNRKPGYAKWYKYPASASSLKAMINEAYAADTNVIDNSREKMKRNTSC
ncbi:MAG: TIR domain-containing protein [bacterium]|nr:TIR domain-containing protein [bacterium]